jgi:hypothetical protein
MVLFLLYSFVISDWREYIFKRQSILALVNNCQTIHFLTLDLLYLSRHAKKLLTSFSLLSILQNEEDGCPLFPSVLKRTACSIKGRPKVGKLNYSHVHGQRLIMIFLVIQVSRPFYSKSLALKPSVKMACGSPDTMKAVQVATFGGPEELRVQTIPVPSVGDDDVLVRVFAAGVNPVETYIRAGTYANLPALPFTPGNDGAGIIEQVGVNVKTKKIGDRVYIGKAKTGTYAEYTVCDGASVYSIPDSVTFEQV